MKGVVEIEVDIPEWEVTVTAKAGQVKAEQLIEAVNNAQDSSHTFKAKLKRGPVRKE
mgnify:CR=1 FL=1